MTSAGIDSASPDIRGLSAVESNAREMMEIRLIIEPSIAYYAALRGTEEEFQRIDEYRIRVEEVIAAGKNRTSAEQDFHNALAAATHNQFAMQLMQVVNKSIYLEVKYHEEGTNLATHSIPDHREIVNFLRRRNPMGQDRYADAHSSRDPVQSGTKQINPYDFRSPGVSPEQRQPGLFQCGKKSPRFPRC